MAGRAGTWPAPTVGEPARADPLVASSVAGSRPDGDGGTGGAGLPGAPCAPGPDSQLVGGAWPFDGPAGTPPPAATPPAAGPAAPCMLRPVSSRRPVGPRPARRRSCGEGGGGVARTSVAVGTGAAPGACTGAGSRPSATASSMLRAAAADGRSAGFFAISACSTGASGPACRGSGSGSVTIAVSVDQTDVRRNGAPLPSTAAYSVMPSDQMSEAGVGSMPCARSGGK